MNPSIKMPHSFDLVFDLKSSTEILKLYRESLDNVKTLKLMLDSEIDGCLRNNGEMLTAGDTDGQETLEELKKLKVEFRRVEMELPEEPEPTIPCNKLGITWTTEQGVIGQTAYIFNTIEDAVASATSTLRYLQRSRTLFASIEVEGGDTVSELKFAACPKQESSKSGPYKKVNL